MSTENNTAKKSSVVVIEMTFVIRLYCGFATVFGVFTYAPCSLERNVKRDMTKQRLRRSGYFRHNVLVRFGTRKVLCL